MTKTAQHRPATRRRRFAHDDLVAVDLFSGFGGFTQGAELAGFTTIMAANHNEYKVKVHEANHPNAEHWIADLVDTESADYHSVRDLPPGDLLLAGVSCVNHSQANTTKAYEQRMSLFDLDDPEFDARVTRSERDRATANCVLHYATQHHPRLILLECTTELSSWGPAIVGRPKVGDGTTYRWWLKEFTKLGYRSKRLKGMGSAAYQLDGPEATSGPGFLAHEWPRALDWPLHKTKPLRIFVNSMSDLFHANISDEYIAQVWAVMSLAPQQTFQILTKRHARMRGLVGSAMFRLMVNAHRMRRGYSVLPDSRRADGTYAWPLPNVWLGVSAEDQHWYTIRWPALRETPAAVRFISFEPLLDEVSMFANTTVDTGVLPDWAIVGGESGPGARPMNPRWARQLRYECTEYGVPFLFKQWGEHDATGKRVGKKAAGRELDGRTWDEYPVAK